ncbi:MAG: ABC transporter permease [Massiliimalia sp.]|jgi:ABC-2 type transport system permease protein
MNKFWILLKKELRELVTVQTLIGVLASVLIFVFLGNMMGGISEESAENASRIGIVDQDHTPLTQNLTAQLEAAGFEVVLLEGNDGASEQELLDLAKQENLQGYLEFPKGMEQSIQRQETVQCRLVSRMTSLSITGSSSSAGITAAFQTANELLSNQIMEQSQAFDQVSFAKNPLSQQPVTVVGENRAEVSEDLLKAFAMQQSMLIPIIVFLLITYATQMTVSTVASEKNDKTLETLLSAPVPRLAVLGAKMCAAGFLSLMMAGVYMIGFSRYMSGMMGGEIDQSQLSQALETLGLNLQGTDYLLLGIQMFLTILIALAVSVVLGALAKDVKAAQGMVTPILFLAMIPYFVTLTTDVADLPMAAQVVLYLIPFTHTFCASGNIIFHNDLIFYGGMVYQLVLLCIVMGLAVKIFGSDRIFTMTLSWGEQKRKQKKKTVKQ